MGSVYCTGRDRDTRSDDRKFKLKRCEPVRGGGILHFPRCPMGASTALLHRAALQPASRTTLHYSTHPETFNAKHMRVSCRQPAERSRTTHRTRDFQCKVYGCLLTLQSTEARPRGGHRAPQLRCICATHRTARESTRAQPHLKQERHQSVKRQNAMRRGATDISIIKHTTKLTTLGTFSYDTISGVHNKLTHKLTLVSLT